MTSARHVEVNKATVAWICFQDTRAWLIHVQACDLKFGRIGACPQNMEQPAVCLFHLHVNLWKCEGDISGERSGPLFKFPVQTARARLDVVWVLVCISPALLRFFSFDPMSTLSLWCHYWLRGVQLWACISAHRGLRGALIISVLSSL
jgi:hypothetical protein